MHLTALSPHALHSQPDKFNFDMSSNISALSFGCNKAFIAYPQLNNSLLNAGIFINDVAIDADNGDAYFTDSSNCREDSATMHRFPLISFMPFVLCENWSRCYESCHGIGRVGRCFCLCLVARLAKTFFRFLNFSAILQTLQTA